MPTSDDMTLALSALTDAIEAGTDIPSEFQPFVNQHLPAPLSMRAKYADHSALLGVGGRGLIRRAINGNALSKRSVYDSAQQGSVYDSAQQGSVYDSAQQSGGPRMAPPATRWRT